MRWYRIRRRRSTVTKHYVQHKEQARLLVHNRLGYWNQYYNFDYNRVAIRNQRSCWGSCTAKGNLNFNYKLLFLPPALADYVIVHELCHLKELHHGPAFWALMAQTIPDYAERKKSLRELERQGISIQALLMMKENGLCYVASST